MAAAARMKLNHMLLIRPTVFSYYAHLSPPSHLYAGTAILSFVYRIGQYGIRRCRYTCSPSHDLDSHIGSLPSSSSTSTRFDGRVKARIGDWLVLSPVKTRLTDHAKKKVKKKITVTRQEFRHFCVSLYVSSVVSCVIGLETGQAA